MSKLQKNKYQDRDAPRQCLTTKYLQATDKTGPRIKVYGQAGSKTYPYDYGLNQTENHQDAAYKHAEKLGWFDNNTHDDYYCLSSGGDHKGNYQHVLVRHCVR